MNFGMERTLDRKAYGFIFERLVSEQTVIQPKTIMYRNCVYQGGVETDGSADGQKLVPHGLGLLFFLDGRLYFGNFEKGLPNSWGTLVFKNQTFVHAEFKHGIPEGLMLYCNRSETMVLTIKDSQLVGNIVCLVHPINTVFVIDSATSEPINIYQLSKSEFDKLHDELLEAHVADKNHKDFPTNKFVISKIDKTEAKKSYFSCFENRQSGFIYFGAHDSDLNLNGLGVLLKTHLSLCYGNFKNSKLSGFSIFMGSACSYAGKYYEGLPDGETNIIDFISDEELNGMYHKGFLKQIDQKESFHQPKELSSEKEGMLYFGIKGSSNLDLFFTNKAFSFGNLVVNFPENSSSFIHQILQPTPSKAMKSELKSALKDTKTKGKETRKRDLSRSVKRTTQMAQTQEIDTQSSNQGFVKQRVQTFSAKNKRIAGLNDTETLTPKSKKKVAAFDPTLRIRINEHHKNLCWNFNEFYKEKQTQVFENYFRNIPNEKIYFGDDLRKQLK